MTPEQFHDAMWWNVVILLIQIGFGCVPLALCLIWRIR